MTLKSGLKITNTLSDIHLNRKYEVTSVLGKNNGAYYSHWQIRKLRLRELNILPKIKQSTSGRVRIQT